MTKDDMVDSIKDRFPGIETVEDPELEESVYVEFELEKEEGSYSIVGDTFNHSEEHGEVNTLVNGPVIAVDIDEYEKILNETSGSRVDVMCSDTEVMKQLESPEMDTQNGCNNADPEYVEEAVSNAERDQAYVRLIYSATVPRNNAQWSGDVVGLAIDTMNDVYQELT